MSFKRCMNNRPSSMKNDELKACINELIFEPNKSQTDNELLTIVLLRDKEQHLGFLKGFTKWKSIGTWQEIEGSRVVKKYPDERNTSFEIQFKDTKDERVGNKLMELLEELNKKEIKEDLLYCRTSPIEETTL